MADDVAQTTKFAAYSKKSTIPSWEIQTSVWLIEFAKHAISKGMKLVMNDVAQMMFICFFSFSNTSCEYFKSATNINRFNQNTMEVQERKW